jgi:hypothetical protein
VLEAAEGVDLDGMTGCATAWTVPRAAFLCEGSVRLLLSSNPIVRRKSRLALRGNRADVRSTLRCSRSCLGIVQSCRRRIVLTEPIQPVKYRMNVAVSAPSSPSAPRVAFSGHIRSWPWEGGKAGTLAATPGRSGSSDRDANLGSGSHRRAGRRSGTQWAAV